MVYDHNKKVPVYKRLYQQAENKFSATGIILDSDLENLSKSHFENRRNKISFGDKAGPGAYDLPPLMGNFIILTEKRNQPSYSIGTQSRDKILALCKNQAESTKGQSSPGVCKYDSDTLRLKSRAPQVTIGRERRFYNEKTKEIVEKSRPHVYDGIDRESIKEFSNRTNGFPKFPRFVEQERKASEDKLTPSSQSYPNSSVYNTINHNAEKFKNLHSNKSESRNGHVHSKSISKFEPKIYFNELERGYTTKESPGP